jgi:hypothetical protein
MPRPKLPYINMMESKFLEIVYGIIEQLTNIGLWGKLTIENPLPP